MLPSYARKLNPETTLSKHNNKSIENLLKSLFEYLLLNFTTCSFLLKKKFIMLYTPKKNKKRHPIKTTSSAFTSLKIVRENKIDINKLKLFITFKKRQSKKLNFNPFNPKPIARENASIEINNENKKTETTPIL